MSANAKSLSAAQTPATLESRLSYLLDLSLSMFSVREFDPLIRTGISGFLELTACQRGFLYVWDRKGNALTLKGGLNADGSLTSAEERRIAPVINRVLRERRPLKLSDTNTGSDPAIRRLARNMNLQAMFCTPLINRDKELVGVIYVDSKATAASPSGEDERLTAVLTQHVAAAVENACLFERASNDPLTGLPNNSHFLLKVRKAIAQATLASPAGVLLLDLDQFKRVNQVAGAEMGDRALVDVARTLQEVLRTDGLVARWGSDKFGILLPPEDDRIALRLRDVAERARAAVCTKTYHDVRMSASIGGIAFPAEQGAMGEPTLNPADVLAFADDALSRARARGHGNVEIG